MATNNPTPAPSPDLPPAPSSQPPREDPEVARLRSEVQRGRAEIDALKARVTAPPAPAAQPSSADMAREFYKDPIQHSFAIAQQVIDQRLNQQNDPSRATVIQLAKDSVRSKDPQFFDKYYLEIEAAVNTVATQFHGNIQVWENAFKLVKGNHIDEILAQKAADAEAERQRSAAIHVREGGGPDSPSHRPSPAATNGELSADEKRTARKLGLSEEQYKAGKKHYAEQNDPVTDPVGKSSWDEQITFSSRDRARRLKAEKAARRAS